MTKIYGLNENYTLVEMLVENDPVEEFDREHNNTSTKIIFDENGKAINAEPKVETKVAETKVDRKPPYYVAELNVTKVAEPSWKKIRPVRDALFILEAMYRPALKKSEYKKVSAIDRLSDLLKRAEISKDPDQPGFDGSIVIKSSPSEWDSILNDENMWQVIGETDVDIEFKCGRIFVH